MQNNQRYKEQESRTLPIASNITRVEGALSLSKLAIPAISALGSLFDRAKDFDTI